MKVRELIEALSKCDPEAEVVMNEEPVVEGDDDLMEGSMQSIVGIEQGWSDAMPLDIRSDLTFTLGEVPGYTSPAIRLLGPNTEPTSRTMRVTINGVCQLPLEA